MRASTAYFAGAGTVIIAIVGGIGGGLLFADMISPKLPKQELTKLEQRMSSQPIQVKAAPEPAEDSATPPSTTAAPTPAPPAARTEAANAGPTAAPPAETATAARPASPAIQAEAPPSQPAVQPKQAAAPEDSLAKAKPEDSVTKAKPEDSLARAKDADIKRAAVDKRKVDRRQQWTERRRNVQRRDQQLLAFEEKVREETETRPTFAAEPAGAEMPRIRLFDLD
jgi:hypothetical protein